jgi:hypothetical protein
LHGVLSAVARRLEWDAVTLAGSVDSTFDAGCGGAAGGSVTYPFSLVRY